MYFLLCPPAKVTYNAIAFRLLALKHAAKIDKVHKRASTALWTVAGARKTIFCNVIQYEKLHLYNNKTNKCFKYLARVFLGNLRC